LQKRAESQWFLLFAKEAAF